MDPTGTIAPIFAIQRQEIMKCDPKFPPSPTAPRSVCTAILSATHSASPRPLLTFLERRDRDLNGSDMCGQSMWGVMRGVKSSDILMQNRV